MKEYAKIVGIGLVVLVTLAAFGFVLRGMGLLSFSFFAPKEEAVRYKVFKESQTYNDGMIRDLQELKLQYLSANDEQKLALRGIVLHRFSVYPIDRLPPDLAAFYQSLNQ